MSKYRSQSDIISDILTVCGTGARTPTKIMQKVGLAYYQCKDYIHELAANDLIASGDDGCTYFTTDRGFQWLRLEETQSQLLQKDELLIVAN